MTPPFSRRSLLGASLALPFSAPAWPHRRQDPAPGGGKTLLVLGGTRFLGPAVVEAALARGFEVTLFNPGTLTITGKVVVTTSLSTPL